MSIIGIIGEAGCGKTTFANRLCDRHGFVQYSFSKPLKKLCCWIYGWDLEALEFDIAAQRLGYETALSYKESSSMHAIFPVDIAFARMVADSEEVRDIPGAVDHLLNIFKVITDVWTRRQIMQHVGTEGFRGLDPDHWVKRGRKAIIQLLQEPECCGIAIPDMRFVNESAMVVREMDGKIVLLEREGDFTGTGQPAHSSEQEWRQINVDLVVSCPSGIENVYAEVDKMMAPIVLAPLEK